VLQNTRKIASLSQDLQLDQEILDLASFLHDIKNTPKNSPDSHLASQMSAQVAKEWFSSGGIFEDCLTEEQLFKLEDAILCHSFSRGLVPRTSEGLAFQDADRLDAIGAIGIARLFTCSGDMAERNSQNNIRLYHPTDPFFKDASRTLDDKSFSVDHFYKKLFFIADSMKTNAGKVLAKERKETMIRFLKDFENELF
jgi:uncharacterized protein